MTDFDYSRAYQSLTNLTATPNNHTTITGGLNYCGVTTTNDDSIKYANSISVDFNDLLERIIALENSKPEFVELKCKNCGGKIQQRYEDSIIKCPYCKSVYIIGRKQVNDDT